jgi:hypothetical protein
MRCAAGRDSERGGCDVRLNRNHDISEAQLIMVLSEIFGVQAAVRLNSEFNWSFIWSRPVDDQMKQNTTGHLVAP